MPKQEIEGMLDGSAVGHLGMCQMEVHFDPVTAKVTRVAVATQNTTQEINWLSDDDPVLLRQQLAKACEQLGQTSKAKAVALYTLIVIAIKGIKGAVPQSGQFCIGLIQP